MSGREVYSMQGKATHPRTVTCIFKNTVNLAFMFLLQKELLLMKWSQWLDSLHNLIPLACAGSLLTGLQQAQRHQTVNHISKCLADQYGKVPEHAKAHTMKYPESFQASQESTYMFVVLLWVGSPGQKVSEIVFSHTSVTSHLSFVTFCVLGLFLSLLWIGPE